MKITIKFALAALLLAALAACHPSDVDLPGKDAVTISRIQAGIAEMAEAPSTRSFTQDAETGYTGAVKTGFVEGDVIHLIVFSSNSPKRYSTATLNAQGNWDISPALYLNSGETITAFYNGVKEAYENADAALGGAYIEAAKADPSDVLIADGNNYDNQHGGSVTITGGTLAITFAHQHALIRISSIDNRLGTGYDVIKVIANVESASNNHNNNEIPLIHDGSESNGDGEWQCIANGYYAASAEYHLKSFTLTLGSSSDAKATTTSLTIPLSGKYGKDLSYGRSYTYRLLLLPGSATAILQDDTQGPEWTDAHRDPTVPAGYIPLYTVEDLQKIGVNTSSGTSGSPAYYPATVNGYTYKEANADGTGEGTAPLTFSPSANYILMADIDLAATPATGSNAPTDAANWTPIGGTSISFTGRFNGNGHTIKGMKVSSSNDAYIGFFRSLSGATIYNLHFQGATVTDATSEASTNAGTLAGQAINSNIALCSATNCTVSGKNYIGGLIGFTENAHLTRCHATNCTVTGTYYSGGLTGSNDGTSILACYSTDCTATANATNTNTGARAGGLSGYNTGTTLYGCYATGAKATVTGNSSSNSYAGALAGYLSDGSVISCYARTGTGSTPSPGVTTIDATPVEATLLIDEISGATILACISPLKEGGSGSSSEPTGTTGITYWGATAGYSPLTNTTALTESGSGGSGSGSDVSHASLSGVRTVRVNTTGKSILQAAITNSSGGSIVPEAIIPPGGIYVKARTWSATGIWGSNLPTGTPTSQVPPHIRWNYEGELATPAP